MQSRYVIFSCRNTMELHKQSTSLFGTYLPIERTRRVRLVRNVEVRTTVERPAMPGLIFLPLYNAPEFRRKVPEQFNIRQHFSPQGFERFVVFEELTAMQAALNLEYEGEPAQGLETVYCVGDRVVIIEHPLFKGLTGTVAKGKRLHDVRVLIARRTVTLPRRFLQRA